MYIEQREKTNKKFLESCKSTMDLHNNHVKDHQHELKTIEKTDDNIMILLSYQMANINYKSSLLSYNTFKWLSEITRDIKSEQIYKDIEQRAELIRRDIYENTIIRLVQCNTIIKNNEKYSWNEIENYDWFKEKKLSKKEYFKWFDLLL